GVTAGAALHHPIETLDIVEISAAVVEASRFFNHVNHEALKDPRVRLIIGDGRNHLRHTPATYDVTISEPSNPWMSGMASLFTREFFLEVRARLSESGIHCQWLHSYNMSTEDLRTIVRTFRAAFPYAILWGLNENDFLLLGSPAPIDISGNVARNFERVRPHLADIRVQDLYSILSLYLLGNDDLDRFAGDALLNTDDLPILEFRTPRFLYANTADQNLEAVQSIEPLVPRPEYISQATANPSPDNHRHKGEMYLFAGSSRLAAREFQSVLARDVRDVEAWKGLVQAAVGRNRPAVTEFIDRMVTLHPDPVVLLAAAEHYLRQSEYAKARELLSGVLETDPRHAAALEKLCEVFSEEGNPELAATAEKLLALDPGNARGLFHLATARYRQGRFDESIELVRKSIEAQPANVRSRNLLAVLYASVLQHDRAEAEFLRIIEDQPNDFISYNNYGLFLLQRGRYNEARHQFERSIDIDPENAQGFVGVAETLRQSGSLRLAQQWYRKALKLAPDHPQARMYVR
ncbi:MAG: tetratricopeptide repeat protein, partial [Acidobacteria bacterium]|nr:tetratricopeptide repeat protein [Acidobacteriota bacterium]